VVSWSREIKKIRALKKVIVRIMLSFFSLIGPPYRSLLLTGASQNFEGNGVWKWMAIFIKKPAIFLKR